MTMHEAWKLCLVWHFALHEWDGIWMPPVQQHAHEARHSAVMLALHWIKNH